MKEITVIQTRAIRHQGAIKVSVLCLLASFVYLPQLRAQSADTIRNAELGIELYRISSAYDGMDHMAFSLKYRYRLSDNPSAVTDSSTGVWRVHKGMVYGNQDSIVLLRNSLYTVSVDKEDSMISISNAGSGFGAFNINVFDSLFKAFNLLGYDKTAVTGGSKLTMSFRPDSYYKSFEVTYNSSYQILSMQMSFADLDYDENGLPPPAGRSKIIEVTYTNYHTEVYDLSIFDEGQYLHRNEYGKWVGTGTYAGWQIFSSVPE